MRKFILTLLVSVAYVSGDGNQQYSADNIPGLKWGQSLPNRKDDGHSGATATSYIKTNFGSFASHSSVDHHSNGKWNSFDAKVDNDHKFGEVGISNHGGSSGEKGHNFNGQLGDFGHTFGGESAGHGFGFGESKVANSGGSQSFGSAIGFDGGSKTDHGGQSLGSGAEHGVYGSFGGHIGGHSFSGGHHEVHGSSSGGHSLLDLGKLEAEDSSDHGSGGAHHSFSLGGVGDHDIGATLGSGNNHGHGAGSVDFGHGLLLGRMPFLLHHQPQVHETTKAIPVHKDIQIPVPHPVSHPFVIPVPVKVPEPYVIKIPYPVPVEKTIQVPVEKQIPYPVEKPVPVKVVKKVPVPVPKPYPVPVPVYKTKYIYHTKKTHHHRED